MGFEPLAYKGLETRSRDVVSHVIKQGKVSPPTPGTPKHLLPVAETRGPFLQAASPLPAGLVWLGEQALSSAPTGPSPPASLYTCNR